jgi:hypothetical protein
MLWLMAWQALDGRVGVYSDVLVPGSAYTAHALQAKTTVGRGGRVRSSAKAAGANVLRGSV